jgi:hypothetical protein
MPVGMSRLDRTLLPRLAWLAWLASLVACSSGVEAPWSPSLRQELTGYDYAAYSAWLLAHHPPSGGMVLVDDRTTSTSYPGLSVIRVSEVPVEIAVVCPAQPGAIVTPQGVVPPPPPAVSPTAACGTLGGQPIPVGSQSPARDEASQDLRVQRELSLPLERHLTGAVYRLVHEPIPEDLLRQAALVVAFSRVGFDSHPEVATFEVLRAPVVGGVASSAAAYRVWVERPGMRWKLAEEELVGPVVVWTTTTTVPLGNPPTMTCDSTHTTNCIWPPGPIPFPLPLPRPK